MSYETFIQRSRKIRQILNEQFGVQKMCLEGFLLIAPHLFPPYAHHTTQNHIIRSLVRPSKVLFHDTHKLSRIQVFIRINACPPGIKLTSSRYPFAVIAFAANCCCCARVLLVGWLWCGVHPFAWAKWIGDQPMISVRRPLHGLTFHVSRTVLV